MTAGADNRDLPLEHSTIGRQQPSTH